MYDQLNGLKAADLAKKKEQTDHYNKKLEFGYKIILVITSVAILYNIIFYTLEATVFYQENISILVKIIKVYTAMIFIFLSFVLSYI